MKGKNHTGFLILLLFAGTLLLPACNSSWAGSAARCGGVTFLPLERIPEESEEYNSPQQQAEPPEPILLFSRILSTS